MLPPRDAVAAVTHPDPYPYYAMLRRDHPFRRDDGLGLWVAASAETVTAVLASDSCRVRPAAEPVPRPLLGTSSGAIFGRLVRMTDGDAQARARRAVAAVLASVTPEAAVLEARRRAAGLLGDATPGPAALDALLFALPVHVVGRLLGFDPAQLPRLTALMRDFTAGLAPAVPPDLVAHGMAAATDLLVLMQDLLDGPRRDGLAHRLRDAAEREGGVDPATVAANAIGFLSQSHDATAGLLGNAIVALGARPALRRRLAADRTLLTGLVQEVLRFDPPVQNTRRFVAEDAAIAGRPVRAGDAILVLLAAANRDPAANPDPDRFDPARADRRIFSFGHGRHACPGDAIAAAIAAAGLDALLDRMVGPAWPAEPPRYHPSANARIPMFSNS